MEFRPWTPEDAAACLAIFRSNRPEFFAEYEEAEFHAFLEQPEGPYFVVTAANDRVVASGGFVVEPAAGRASLAWGMVDRAYHRSGFGQFLLIKRLELLLLEPRVMAIDLDTTQHSAGFFARLGFAVRRITPDGYAPGMDRIDMRLSVGDADRAALLVRLGAR
ncbi:MAG TPA: GNAT family N-acetyltransferase [Herpetosiphonaceae bacterium]|nr:GNAT family N-acetyltransferase [Herpetosiphonaceae bacterium]